MRMSSRKGKISARNGAETSARLTSPWPIFISPIAMDATSRVYCGGLLLRTQVRDITCGIVLAGDHDAAVLANFIDVAGDIAGRGF